MPGYEDIQRLMAEMKMQDPEMAKSPLERLDSNIELSQMAGGVTPTGGFQELLYGAQGSMRSPEDKRAMRMANLEEIRRQNARKRKREEEELARVNEEIRGGYVGLPYLGSSVAPGTYLPVHKSYKELFGPSEVGPIGGINPKGMSSKAIDRLLKVGYSQEEIDALMR